MKQLKCIKRLIITLTGQRAGARLAFVRQSDIIHNLFHLSLDLLLWQALQTGVEPDVFLHCQPGLQQIAQLPKTRGYRHAKKSVLDIELLRCWDLDYTYMLKRTLCWGQTPRFCRMVLSSVRMSLPRM